jgi:hypothetical protein
MELESVLLICFKGFIVLCIGPMELLNRSTKQNFQLHMKSYTFSPTTITNNWFQSKTAVNTTWCTDWFTTNRSCRTIQSHRTYTHTQKPYKPVGPQLATSQQLKVHETHTETASVVPTEDETLTPETCRGLRHNKVMWKWKCINPLTTNSHCSGRTAPLTSRRCILNIYSTNIRTEYFKHAA